MNQEPRRDGVINVIEEEILSDSADEDSSANPTTSRLRKRRKCADVDYAKYFDSDDEKEENKKKRESLAKFSHEVVNTEVFLAHLSFEPGLVKTCENLLFHEYDVNTHSLVTLFRKCGKYIKRLSFGTVSFQLLRQVQEFCPKLETLTIRSSQQDIKYPYTMQGSSHTLSERRTYPQFPKLLELHLESNSFLTNQEDFTNLLKACQNLEALFCSFGNLDELTNALTLVTENLSMTSLKSLTVTFAKENEYEEEVVLRQSHILQIATLSSKGAALEKLELIAGIWEDVLANDLNTLMSNYAQSLKHFTIAGNLHGIDLHDKQLVVTVPKLEKLISFAMGSSYEFEEVFENPESNHGPSTSTSSTPRNNIISLTEKHLITLVLNFQYIMPSLESIQLGNLIEIDKIHPRTFPKIRVFRIGSGWNKSIDLPVEESIRRFPEFQLVRELQLPDCLKDEFFVQKVRSLFPKVRKVWINLPSVKCLRHFFHAMSGSDISELHLKTQYDFNGVLETALLARPRRSLGTGPSTTNRKGEKCASLAQLMKLKNSEDGDKVLNEFIRYHNIELPLSDDDEILQKSIGVGSLSSLRALYLEHIPRRLKIPTNNRLPHYHQRQVFHPTLTIGFKYYPLSRKFFHEELQHLRNLETFKYGHNFQGTSGFVLPSMCVYTGNSSHSYRSVDLVNTDEVWQDEDWGNSLACNFDENGSISKKSKKLKVKILPSTLANDQFRVKPEKFEPGEVESPAGFSAGGVETLSTREIKNEAVSDDDD